MAATEAEAVKAVLPADDGGPAPGPSLTMRAINLLAARTVAFVLSFALPLLLVRRLSIEEFGLYKQVFLVVSTAYSMVPLGFGMSAYYFLPREKARRGQVVLNVVLFYLLTSGLVCVALVASPGLLGSLFNSPEIAGFSPLIGLTIVFWVVPSFLEIVAIANEESRLSTVFIVTSQLTKTLLLVAAAVGFGTVRALIYAALAQGVVQTAILLWYLRSRFGAFWSSFRWSTLREQLAYALPFGVSAVLLQFQSDMPHYFVSHEFGAASYAIYSIGVFNLPLIWMLADSAGSVMIPRVSRLQSEGDHREIVELTARMLRKLAAVYFPIYAFLMLFGREFITLLFTDRYLSAWPVFAINLTLIPLTIVVSGCDPVMRAFADVRFFLLRVRVVLIVALAVGLWFFAGALGLTGTVAVVVATNVVERAVTARKAATRLGATWRDLRLFGDVARLAAASAVAGAAAAVVRAVAPGMPPFATLAVCGSVFGLTYAAVAVALGVPTEGERALVEGYAARARRLLVRRTAAERVS